MDILVSEMSFPKGDHLWLENSESDMYFDNNICEGCGGLMSAISMVKNDKDELGLVTGLCPTCGYVKRIRNLSQDWYGEHFAKRWMTGMDETISDQHKLHENKYVFNKLSKYIPVDGSILDVGCGIGQRLLPFHNAGFNVYGVDPSEHRTALAAEVMANIEVGSAEGYLDNSPNKFDVIYFFNVLQFVENPFNVLEKAVKKLSNGGIIFFSVGQFYNDSNYWQFSHLGVVRSFLSFYSMNEHFKKLDLWPVEYSEAPFEIVLRKGSENRAFAQIFSGMEKVTMQDIEQYARNTLHPIQLKFFGRASINYQERRIILKRKKSFDRMAPVVFRHNGRSLPILLK
jgi:SAM-dependent methyltransferase